jgi:hypothetical protein
MDTDRTPGDGGSWWEQVSQREDDGPDDVAPVQPRERPALAPRRRPRTAPSVRPSARAAPPDVAGPDDGGSAAGTPAGGAQPLAFDERPDPSEPDGGVLPRRAAPSAADEYAEPLPAGPPRHAAAGDETAASRPEMPEPAWLEQTTPAVAPPAPAAPAAALEVDDTTTEPAVASEPAAPRSVLPHPDPRARAQPASRARAEPRRDAAGGRNVGDVLRRHLADVALVLLALAVVVLVVLALRR